MSEEFAKHHDKLSSSELKTMTTELKKSKKSLSDLFTKDIYPEFDTKLLSSIMTYINKIKRSTTISKVETGRKTQQVNFLEALTDFQSLLKTLKKQKKEHLESPQKKVKKRSVVKIQGIKQGIKGKSVSQIKELDRHLHLTESKLRNLKKGYQKGQNVLNNDQYKDITSLLKKANVYLTKTKALQSSLSGKAKPEFNTLTIHNLLSHINFLQNSIESEIQAGAALTQANLFWYTLREFQTLVQELENLKKSRGKIVAKVETDLLS